MDIGIITHYDVHNHGALLQLNALKKSLQAKGFNAAALQFEKNYDFMGIIFKDKYQLSLRSIPIYIKYLFKNGLRRTIFNIKKKQLLDKFKLEEKLIGKYYTEYKNLEAVIIGSDEVFALHTGPTPIFWGYCLPSKNVFSYAACFGPTTINDINDLYCGHFVKSGLEGMKNISVRDQNSFNIVKELIGRNVTMVCDPVILYGYKKEIENLPRIDLKPYLLIYSYDNNMNEKSEVERIKDYAKKRGLQIISSGFYHNWCDKNINVDPVTILSYFRDAECVVTDTFHGSVMSIITNTDFLVFLRGNQNKLGNLLNEYNLNNRVIQGEEGLDDVSQNIINWDSVNNEITKRRNISKDYLEKSLSINI